MEPVKLESTNLSARVAPYIGAIDEARNRGVRWLQLAELFNVSSQIQFRKAVERGRLGIAKERFVVEQRPLPEKVTAQVQVQAPPVGQNWKENMLATQAAQKDMPFGSTPPRKRFRFNDDPPDAPVAQAEKPVPETKKLASKAWDRVLLSGDPGYDPRKTGTQMASEVGL